MLEALLTMEDAAAILKVSPRTLKEWCRRGKIDCVKVGREWRLREAAVAAMIKSPMRLVTAPQEDLDAINAAMADTDRQ